jgi:rhodanese-related sulfurtransferase
VQHAGDVTPDEAWALLEEDPAAVLVDVRTRAEWTYVGIPDLADADKQPVLLEWTQLDGRPNPSFLDDLAAEVGDRDAPVLFLCRSGARSAAAAAAATAAGFTRAHNVAGGFEGDLDGSRHRGTTGGWKASGLPWVQS